MKPDNQTLSRMDYFDDDFQNGLIANPYKLWLYYSPHMDDKQQSNPWIVRPRVNPSARMRLFCFPFAGGSATAFYSWASQVPPTIDVCPVQPPGRGGRMKEAPFVRAHAMVAALSRNLLGFLDLPFAFFGHSMGAVIAYELACQLRRQADLSPFYLFVSGRNAPHIRDTELPTYNLPDDEFIEELRRLNGTPKEVLENPDLMSLMLPLLRADFELIQNYEYTPEPPLSCPITAFGGLADTETSSEGIDEWRQHTARSFSRHFFAGDHFFISTHERHVLRLICEKMSQVPP